MENKISSLVGVFGVVNQYGTIPDGYTKFFASFCLLATISIFGNNALEFSGAFREQYSGAKFFKFLENFYLPDSGA